MGTISVVGKFIVLYVVYKSNQLRHSQYIYKFSIAFSDIIWGIFISTYFVFNFLRVDDYNQVFYYDFITNSVVTKDANNITIYKYEIPEVSLVLNTTLNKNVFYDVLYFALDYVAPITLLVSFISLMFASIDRYVALTFPFRYKQINSIKLAKIVSVFNWVASAVSHTVTAFLAFKRKSLPFLLFQPTFTSKYMMTLNQIITAAILFFLFFLLLILTFMTLCSLYKSYKRSSALNKKSLKGFSLEKQMSFVLEFMIVAFTFSLFSTTYLHIGSTIF